MERINPILSALAPDSGNIPHTAGREKDKVMADHGYLYCGSTRAGHSVKMLHKDKEYVSMAIYAEGLNILRHANVGSQERKVDVKATPVRHPVYQLKAALLQCFSSRGDADFGDHLGKATEKIGGVR